MKITVNTGEKRQTVTGFGVSGAWWAQEVGLWSEKDRDGETEKREAIARLLFSREEGIGITQYRYNLGSGSLRSGKGTYGNPDRRADCFADSDGNYDFSRDEGAVWFMNRASQLGADEITLFVNSPPEFMTKNGMGHCSYPMVSNLSPKNYERFADYVLASAKHFASQGVPVKYISPVNEPVWVWTGGQEGCHYSPSQVKKLLGIFARKMKADPAFEGVKLSGAENGDIRWFNKSYTRVMRSSPIKEMTDAVDVHSYFLPVPGFIPGFIAKPLNDRLAFVRRFRKYMDRRFPGVAVKTSEWCHMQGGRNCGIDSALEQAKVMAQDLTLLSVTAWQLWVALSHVDYCDGLIYYDNDSRDYELTKRYYAFGNFSKFVRPGAVRLETEAEGGIIALAFEQRDNYALILINPGDAASSAEICGIGGKAKIYVTDGERNLAEEETDTAAGLKLTPKSVTTVIIDK